ncbi:MAG: peptidoglycan DD-metalloendopeptidase family protein [Clostridia bacterium]|nr:peptidoglycan DD-metalloendopeptidase family protein [Clostridia bacterium]
MKNDRMTVTVKRIEKIPSRFYAQVPQTAVKVNQKAKVSVDDSLLARYRQLTESLGLGPAVEKDFSGGFAGRVEHWFLKAKTAMISRASAFKAWLMAEAKQLAFSCAVSLGVVAMAAVIMAATCSIGYVVTVNDQQVGILQNKGDYARLINEINAELNYIQEESFSPADASVAMKVIAKNGFTDETDVKERIKAAEGDMLPAYAVYAGEEILFALPNKEMAVSVLEDYKSSFVEDKEGVQADFCEQVTVARRFVPKTALKTQESAAESLSLGRVIVHSVGENETLEQIAETYGVAADNILQSNYIADWDDFDESSLRIYTGQPLLSVKTVEYQSFQEEVPFQTIEKEDAAKYCGSVIVEQEGSSGARVVEAYITKVNGVETERKVVSEQMLSAAVDRVITKGTKELPSSGGGSFQMPSNGKLTSRFGSRWGRKHNGIDVSAAVGTNIYAADSGKVIYSQYNNGGFGYLIQIDHGNGIVTYYAHCNELLVPEGTVVAKGDVIATVGNTGRSTGPHLHFEVRVNGTPVDPGEYLNK